MLKTKPIKNLSNEVAKRLNALTLLGTLFIILGIIGMLCVAFIIKNDWGYLFCGILLLLGLVCILYSIFLKRGYIFRKKDKESIDSNGSESVKIEIIK